MREKQNWADNLRLAMILMQKIFSNKNLKTKKIYQEIKHSMTDIRKKLGKKTNKFNGKMFYLNLNNNLRLEPQQMQLLANKLRLYGHI